VNRPEKKGGLRSREASWRVKSPLRKGRKRRGRPAALPLRKGAGEIDTRGKYVYIIRKEDYGGRGTRDGEKGKKNFI